MTELLTAAQMRAIEQAAIGSGQVSGLELMERAGRGVVDAILEEWPDLAKTSHRSVVFCGPGNNGGDGFVVARLLQQRGWEVEVFHYGDPDKLPPDAAHNCRRWQITGKVQPWNPAQIGTMGADMFVDAVFGSGLSRAPGHDILQPLRALFTSGALDDRMVSIDAPSGLCLDSGKALSQEFGAVHSALTVTFHRARHGQFLNEGPVYCGKLRIADIGLEAWTCEAQSTLLPTGLTSAPDLPLKSGNQFKFDHGHSLILAGPPGRGGAARLAARGALRIGAGLVTVGCPPDALTENAARLDAVMLKPVHDADALARILQDGRINALCLGPGMGLGEREASLVAVALGGSGVMPRSTVLDADALSLLAADRALFGALHENCILTPHAGEFTRLFPDISEKLTAPAKMGPAYSKVDATREAAARAGCVVLFKGADTVIAEPSGRVAINAASYDRAAPWLATAGSGDVLSGYVTGLLARGCQLMQAAETAAWLHVDCARRFGPGLIAEDLPEQLPAVFRDLDS